MSNALSHIIDSFIGSVYATWKIFYNFFPFIYRFHGFDFQPLICLIILWFVFNSDALNSVWRARRQNYADRSWIGINGNCLFSNQGIRLDVWLQDSLFKSMKSNRCKLSFPQGTLKALFELVIWLMLLSLNPANRIMTEITEEEVPHLIWTTILSYSSFTTQIDPTCLFGPIKLNFSKTSSICSRAIGATIDHFVNIY